MWPWEHLAFGYLIVSVAWRLSDRKRNGLLVMAVAAGTQFPDLVDRPLYHLGALPAARSLTHSLLVAAPLCLIVLVAAIRRDRFALGVAFTIGYLSHLLGDALPAVIEGHYGSIRFLLWPVYPATPGMGTAFQRMLDVLMTPEVYLTTLSYRTAMVLLVIVVWIDDGLPVAVEVGRYIYDSAGGQGSR